MNSLSIGLQKIAPGKVLRSLCGVVALVLGSFFYLVIYNINREASDSFLSRSGQYRIECVDVLFPFFYDRYVYFRFTELANPFRIYRSPVVKYNIDLSSFESSKQVGVVWLGFDKETHRFTLGYPQWRESWINVFISNTPYTVQPNG
jgi:hypothetical protein